MNGSPPVTLTFGISFKYREFRNMLAQAFGVNSDRSKLGSLDCAPILHILHRKLHTLVHSICT